MTAIAGLSAIRFEPAVRVDGRNYPALKSLGVSHKAAFEFELDGKPYWGECFRTRGVAGYGYDSAIRTRDTRGRTYTIRDSAMPAIREEIAAGMQSCVRDYAAAIDATPTPSAPVQVESPRFLFVVLKGDKGTSYLCEGGVYSSHPQGEYARNSLAQARLDVAALNSRYLGAADKPYTLVASPVGLIVDRDVHSSLEQWQLDAVAAPAPSAPADVIPESLWPVIVRPGMYAGEPGASETRRAYLERAIAAYQSAKP